MPISTVLVIGVLPSISTHRLLDEQQSLLVHTHEVIETTKNVLIGLDDAETGQRGYLLTGDPRDLHPCTKALQRLATLPATLRTQVSDNPTQAARLDTLAGLMRQQLDRPAAGIAARDAHGAEAAVAVVRATDDQARMDAIRRVIGQVTEAEKALVVDRAAAVQRDERWGALGRGGDRRAVAADPGRRRTGGRAARTVSRYQRPSYRRCVPP